MHARVCIAVSHGLRIKVLHRVADSTAVQTASGAGSRYFARE
jgi:hypothetical protein